MTSVPADGPTDVLSAARASAATRGTTPPAGLAPADDLTSPPLPRSPRRRAEQGPAFDPLLGVDLDAATIPELQERMAAGTLTAVDLTAAYLRRVKAVDAMTNAVLAVSPAALGEAAASDARRARGEVRGPLDGIPVLLKDSIDARGLPTTAGSRALLRARPRDAAATRRLRAAGAVVLGKANLTEWANYRSSRSTSGWSAVGGLTRHPYALDRNACGSSTGSSVAVAVSLAQVSLGTETDGSIVCPAATAGVVGVKPSLGLVSRAGVVPISTEQDVVGPMARHVVDAALALAALQGRDGADPATAQRPRGYPAGYTLDPDALSGARIGLWRLAGQDAGVDRLVRRAEARLREVGASVVPVDLGAIEEIYGDETTALNAEFRRDVEAYLAATPGDHPRTLAELVEFNHADPVECRYFGQETFEAALASPPADDPEVAAARSRARALARRLVDDALTEHALDAIAAPTNGPAWLTTLGGGDAFSGPTSSTPAAVAGYPNVTVPIGLASRLPIGLSFVGTRWSDPRILALAYAFEQATRWRRPPTYRATVG